MVADRWNCRVTGILLRGDGFGGALGVINALVLELLLKHDRALLQRFFASFDLFLIFFGADPGGVFRIFGRFPLEIDEHPGDREDEDENNGAGNRGASSEAAGVRTRGNVAA